MLDCFHAIIPENVMIFPIENSYKTATISKRKN